MSKDPKSGHYDAGGIESFDVIKAKLTADQLQGYCLGNALKYMQRANFKDDILRDTEKAITYMCWLKESLLDQEKVGVFTMTGTMSNMTFVDMTLGEHLERTSAYQGGADD